MTMAGLGEQFFLIVEVKRLIIQFSLLQNQISSGCSITKLRHHPSFKLRSHKKSTGATQIVQQIFPECKNHFQVQCFQVHTNPQCSLSRQAKEIPVFWVLTSHGTIICHGAQQLIRQWLNHCSH
jgi:hypothetical protein